MWMVFNSLSLSRFPRSQKGFTLVELSIVLVIIGLLIGGILAAQSMISTAKINAQVRQLQQFDIAVQNFKMNFNYFPGEKAASDNCGGSNWGICSYGAQVGNNRLDTGCCDNHPGGDFRLNYFEGIWTFIELHQFGMISDKYEMWTPDAEGYGRNAVGKSGVIPESKITSSQKSGILPISNARGDVFWFLSVRPGNNTIQNLIWGWFSFATGGPYVIPNDALALDSKLDDGVPATGNVVAVATSPASNDTDYYPLPVDTNDGACISGSGYNVTVSSPQCSILVKAQAD